MNRFEKPSAPKFHGFTLVELLVVIGIIAVLISILLPAIGSARVKAQSLACASNMRQIGMAEHMYANENNDYFTPCKNTNVGDKWKTNQTYQVTLSPYLSRIGTIDKIFVCPAFTPYDGGTSGLATAYGVNQRILADWDPVTLNYKTFSFQKWQYRRRSVKSPTKVMLVGEKNDASDRVYSSLTLPAGPVQVSIKQGEQCGYRMSHGKNRANVLFVDGHVEPVYGFKFTAASNPLLTALTPGSGMMSGEIYVIKDDGMWTW